MVRTFITLEEILCASEAKARIFITLNGPLEVVEGIVVLIKYNTPMGVVPGISYPMGIHPKHPDMVIVSIILAHGDHF